MRIVSIEYSIATKSLDIFVAGCLSPHCEGCYNMELIDFSSGTEMLLWLDKIEKYLIDYDSLIENIFLLGGSFNHQTDVGLETFFRKTEEMFKDKKVWLFAREGLLNIKRIFKERCHYIKCGKYDETLKGVNEQYGVVLATLNQKIYSKENLDY